jgi:hypothetical protein
VYFYSRYYLPLEKGYPLHFNKIESHPPKDDLCQVWLKLAQWFWRRLIISCFTSRWRVFHLYGDVTIIGEGLQNLGLCSVLRAFDQGVIFIVPHLLWHGALVFLVSSEGPPIQSPLMTCMGMQRTYSKPDLHRDLEKIDWLIDYLRFYVPLWILIISLIWRRYHCRWTAAKYKPMLGTQGLRAGKDLYRATPAVTRGLGFSGLIQRTAPISRFLQHAWWYGGPILTQVITGWSGEDFIQIKGQVLFKQRGDNHKRV